MGQTLLQYRDVAAQEAGEIREVGCQERVDPGIGGTDPDAVQENEEDDGQYRTDDTDGRVLAVEIGGSAFLYGLRDLAHAVIAVGLTEYPLCGDEAVAQCQQRGGQGKPECRVHNKNIPSINVRSVQVFL